jgi:hypothetical protein
MALRGHIAIALLGSIAAWSASSAFGQETRSDKSRYDLFEPTPRELMREMSTDRPDKTESPYTVDAGHVQVEMDVVAYSYDRHNPERADRRVQAVGVGVTNWKLGLTNDIDFQLVTESFVWQRVEDFDANATGSESGYGDTVLRTKWNLWGNDGGQTAFALMPYLKLPTNEGDLGNNDYEGGLILPLAIDLGNDTSLGVMHQLDVVRDADDDGYDLVLVQTVTVSRSLVGDLGGYVEFFAAVDPKESSDWVGTVDLGFTYAITPDVQLDGGVNIGVTRAADDWNPFLGLSVRF